MTFSLDFLSLNYFLQQLRSPYRGCHTYLGHVDRYREVKYRYNTES